MREKVSSGEEKKNSESPSKSNRLIFVSPVSTGAYSQTSRVSMAPESIRNTEQVSPYIKSMEHPSPGSITQPNRKENLNPSSNEIAMNHEDMVSYSL